MKLLFWTLRYRPPPGPDTDMAPPLAALQFMKLHCDTATLLPMADMAPPLGALQLTKLHCDTTTLLPLADTAPPLALKLEQL